MICSRCTKEMEQITASSWMCQPCRRNEYWWPEEPPAEVRSRWDD